MTKCQHWMLGGRPASRQKCGESSDPGQEDRGAEEGHGIDGPETKEEGAECPLAGRGQRNADGDTGHPAEHR